MCMKKADAEIINPDIYFSEAYAKLYEEVEGGKSEQFDFCNENGVVRNVYIKRPVPWRLGDEAFYDAVTPYGYGGPIILQSSDREALIRDYWQAWTQHCREERIVCEFVRFHPMLRNDRDFGRLYNASFNRRTVAIHLDEDFEMTQFKSVCRTAIRKAEKLGVTCSIDEKCDTLETFREIYYKTMAKDSAAGFYFFSKAYFEGLHSYLGERMTLVNAHLEGKIIASILLMRSEDFAHYHLAATDPEFYQYRANNLIIKAACEYALSKGCKLLHLGGGLSSAEEGDQLFRFKRNFARNDENLHEFWLGKAIYDRESYERLVEMRRAEGNFEEGTSFFPEYRS